MQILYVYPMLLPQTAGNEMVNLRNLELLKYINSEVYVYEVPYTSKIQTFKGLLEGYGGGLRNYIVKDILTVIGKRDFDIVFLWSSKAGKLASHISKVYPRIKIVTFFHNVEIQYGEEELKDAPTLKNKFINYVVRKNELLAIENSNALLVMNNRDNHLLLKYYGKHADLILPLGLSDSYHNGVRKDRFIGAENKLRLLFVGSAFFANINGMKWFIENVYPYLSNVEILIVGKRMDNHFTMTQDEKRNAMIRVLGYVDDLKGIYEQSHVVISPIFEGGGMKTKTAEAMMYGCPIVGTTEAFEGYEIDYTRIGGICNSSNEFIYKINQLRDSELLVKCSAYSRDTFLMKYETKALRRETAEFLTSLLNK